MRHTRTPATHLAALFVAMLLASCASAQDPLRRTLAASAIGLREADAITAEAYTAAAARALQGAEDLGEYREIMRPWDGAEQALRLTRGALLTAEAALDAWEAGGRERWPEVAACALSAVAELVATLDGLGVDAPAELRDAVALFEGIAGGACSRGGDHE